MEITIIILLFGWTLEVIGITIVYTSSSRLSNWILDNWMKSMNEEFIKNKTHLKKKNSLLGALGIILVVSGLVSQLMAISFYNPN